MIGKMLGNRYEILEQLGGGGMAIVYKGRDTILNRLVTIKLLRPDYTSDEDFVRRFRREAQAVASLSHPNIVSIYDVGREKDMDYLVMEYVDGEDLRSIIKREGPLEPPKAVRIARQICDALDHAHENNIVHRDVKPHNILITRSGRAKLTDFGIAREASAATMTTSDTIVGSVHYLSPEQARGEVPGFRSDIYSLGVVLYEMLAGGLPFTGDTPISIALKHVQSFPDPISKRNPAIPESLESAAMKALNKEPDKRYQSAREMSLRLEESLLDDDTGITRVIAVDSEDMKALKSSGGQATGQTFSRRLKPTGWAVIIALIVLAAAVGVYGFYIFVNVPEVGVPSVVNKPLEQAESILKENRLKSTVKEQYSSDVPEGYVISQDPGPDGPRVKINRVIALVVSKGSDLRTVPNLVTLDVVNARIKLTEASLQMEEPPAEEYSSEVAKGLIMSQQPAALQKAPRDTSVKVVVSKGPEPANRNVPDLRGKTLDQARTELTGLGLQLDQDIIYQTSTQFLSGRIVSQYPGAGENVIDGTAVKVYVSNGPGPSYRDADVEVEIPDDGRKHVVRISVVDARGANDVYIKEHSPGERVVETVRYWGRATINVYVDNKLAKGQELD
ncbi:MAG: protein kinase [Peptococcaceae bacterium BICA1-7]|nr:MAG: protein kinase [Peptococcaceae bacterium BICA1-7]HBV99535.1 Stk1 family PASTA domain-containing Ser/Thr kinase [Desulfotomaculum sp.]